MGIDLFSQGMKRFHARLAVVKALKDAGLYIETKDNPMQLPICRYVAYSEMTSIKQPS